MSQRISKSRFVQECIARYLGQHGPCHLRDCFPAIRAICGRASSHPYYNMWALGKRGLVRKIPGRTARQSKFALTALGHRLYA
jgi:hypothetical protein